MQLFCQSKAVHFHCIVVPDVEDNTLVCQLFPPVHYLSAFTKITRGGQICKYTTFAVLQFEILPKNLIYLMYTVGL
jgi:hypothetical protein